MDTDTTNRDAQLIPDRHPQHDLFICDVLDAIPKDDMASMEHPVFSLSTKPDNRTRRYEHNGSVIEIIPSGKGLATCSRTYSARSRSSTCTGRGRGR